MSAQCPTMGKTSQYNCYMLTHRLQTTPGSHFAIVDSGTPIHIVFDHLFVSNTVVVCVYYKYKYCKWWTLGAPGRATGI